MDVLLEICPGVCDKHVMHEGKQKQKTLCARMPKALHGMFISSILNYKKFRKDVERTGLDRIPQSSHSKLLTGTRHVEDLKTSHENKATEQWKKTCKSDDWSHVKIGKEKARDCMVMIMDVAKEGAMKIDLQDCRKGRIDGFPCKIKEATTAKWTEKLLKIKEDSKNLEEEQWSIPHAFVMKAMLLCERAQPDVDPETGLLSSRVNEATEDDWNRLLRFEWQEFEEKLNVICQDNTRLEKDAIASRTELRSEHQPFRFLPQAQPAPLAAQTFCFVLVLARRNGGGNGLIGSGRGERRQEHNRSVTRF